MWDGVEKKTWKNKNKTTNTSSQTMQAQQPKSKTKTKTKNEKETTQMRNVQTHAKNKMDSSKLFWGCVLGVSVWCWGDNKKKGPVSQTSPQYNNIIYS